MNVILKISYIKDIFQKTFKILKFNSNICNFNYQSFIKFGMDPKRKIQKVDSDIDIKNDSIGSKSLEHAENVVEDNGDTVVENKIKKSSDECLQQREESQKEITKKQNNSKSETQKGSARKRPNCFLSIPITNQEVR